MKKNMFILYSWATVILWFGLIYLFSTFESFEPDGSYQHWIITSIGYELAYALQFLLIFRALLMSLKLKVERLMYWKSKREKNEDAEFARIIEVLLLLIAILFTFILAIFDEYHQSGISGQIASINDILVNLTGILFSAFIVFIVPIISEIEARLLRVGEW